MVAALGPTMIHVASLLALISAVGMGILTSESIQVGLYRAGLNGLDTVRRGMPAWLTAKGDMDVPEKFLTDGAVADAILAATLSAEEVRLAAAPRLGALRQLDQVSQELGNLGQNLALAAATSWVSLEGAGWRRRYEEELAEAAAAARAAADAPAFFWSSGSSQWRTGNESLAIALEGNLTRIRAGDLDEALWAYGSEDLWRTVKQLRAQTALDLEEGRLGIFLGLSATGDIFLEEYRPGLEADLALLANRCAGSTSRFHQFVEYKLKEELAVRPRLAAARAAIAYEQSASAYRDYLDWESARVGKVARAGAHLSRHSSAAAEFEEFLTRLHSWGFDFPEDIGRKVRGAEPLTRRDMARRLAVEHFRRSPNRWITLFIVSVFLGFMGFSVSVCYSLAFIINMGILGTTRNLVGILYVRSEGALRRARIEAARSPPGDLSPTLRIQDRDVRQHPD